MKYLFYLQIFLVLGACNSKKSAPESAKTINVVFESKSGTQAKGTATFTERNGTVYFSANLTGLDQGEHAIHIHEKADCSSGDASSAGGHWNPTFTNHGKWGVGSYHRGDIGNFTVGSDQKGSISMSTDEWCIGCADKTRDILGKSLIVHEKADDFTTQPTGNAGGRMACAAIIR
jgi:superoxide dismutase, Cu-Zn family